ncbi:MAG: hypothetical protein H7343_01700 [Undibacterium sp.]|nr:hypothetical protein [Opitutaceae bacterium]
MTPVLSYLLGVFTSWFVFRIKERDARIRNLVEEYLRVEPTRDVVADDIPRLRAFQRSGVGLLGDDREVAAARKRIVQRGVRDPLSGWECVENFGALRFFREANASDIELDGMESVIRVCMIDQDNQQKDSGDHGSKVI